MIQEFRLPDLAEGVVEGELVSWLVSEGEQVTADQPLLEVMTDKATVEVPSPWTGVVKTLCFKEGETVPVGALLLEIEEAGGESSGAPASGSASPAASVEPTPPPGHTGGNGGPPTAAAVAPSTPAPAAAMMSASPPPATRPAGSKILATPATRKLARELGIDLALVPGSGPKGRVTKDDVKNFAGSGQPAPAPAPAPRFSAPAAPAPIASVAAEDQRIPIKGLRKKIAERMVQSAFTAPHFTYVEEVDVTELVEVRGRLKHEALNRPEPVKLTYLPLIIKALVLSFRKFPHLNALMDDAKNELVVKGAANIGIATATDAGLIVPVVKNCESRSVLSIAQEISRVSDAARAGKSALDDIQGSTFTITNLGPLGGIFATPIINYPEVAILGIHKMRKTPVLLDDDNFTLRQVMNVSLSFDHRVIDGHIGALFTQEIKKYLENPSLLFLDLV